MPNISVNLSDVEAFENLPLGRYYGEIDKVTHREAKEEGKYPQLMATYTVIDGDLLGRKSSEFVSLSPKAAFRLKRWFAKFGFGDVDDIHVDDETEELDDPDLVGTRVIFEVKEEKDKRDGSMQVKTYLVSVEDEVPGAPEPAVTKTALEAPQSKTARTAAPAVAQPRQRTLR